MLKFFRKIRYKLMYENKTTRYLKYAIGEIVLVMIGIILALQVNNWNELRMEKQLERRYLSELMFDLQADSTAIAYLKIRSAIQWKAKQNLIDFFNKKQNFTRDSLSNYFNRQWQATYSFTPITTTLDEMRSTGNIGVINNVELRRKILQTYNSYQLFINNHERIYNKQQGETWKLLFSTVPNLYTASQLQTNNADVMAALSNFEIRNRLFGNYVHGLNIALNELSISNSELLLVLKEEIKIKE